MALGPETLARISRLGTPCGAGRLKFVFASLVPLHLQHRRDSFKQRDRLGPDPPKTAPSTLGSLDFPVSPLGWRPSKEQPSLFRLCIYRSIILPLSLHFPKVRVGFEKLLNHMLTRDVSPHPKLSPCRAANEAFTGFIVAFSSQQSTENGSLKVLCTVDDCLPTSHLKYHNCL